MAMAKTHYARPSHRFLDTDQSYYTNNDSGFEFDEADLYDSVHTSSEIRRKFSGSTRSGKKSSNRNRPSPCGGAASVPVNVPDWSKILLKEHRDENRRRNVNDDDDDDGDWLDASGERLPPHEFLARTRMASFSVHEGVGRTLKGRDMSRVRNAIFEKIGFQD